MASIRIRWGSTGHEFEHMIHVEKSLTQYYDSESGYIDYTVERSLQAALPEGFVLLNRGTRLEIIPPRQVWINRERSIIATEAHDQVKAAVISVFGDDVSMDIYEAPEPPPKWSCRFPGCDDVAETPRGFLEHKRTCAKRTN